MSTAGEVIEDLVAMLRRDAITEAELARIVRLLRESGDRDLSDGEAMLQAEVDVAGASRLPQVQRDIRGTQRRSAGRGRSGWVDSECARNLDLVALMELGGTATRPEMINHIE